MRVRKSPIFLWRRVGSLRFRSAAAEANRMVSTTRVSRATERRAIPVTPSDRCRAPIGRSMTSRRRSTHCVDARTWPLGPILVGGVSRGGVLSIAYAGMHPEQVLGVLNFVGGWLGEGCSTAGEVNGALFQRGGKFGRPTLWLYGHHDSFYSINHSRSNFDAFKKAGGEGEFFEYAVPGGIGHALVGYPNLWSGDLERYLTAIGAPRPP